MVRISISLAAMLLAGMPVAVVAPAATASAAATVAGEPVGEELFDAYFGHMAAGEFESALALSKRMKPGKDDADQQAIVMAMRAAALLGLDRVRESERLIERMEKLSPDSPHPTVILFSATVLTKRTDVSANAFDRLIARFPATVMEFEPELVWHVLRNEPKGQEQKNGDRRIALATMGYGGSVVVGDHIAAEAIEVLAKRGDWRRAGEILNRIDEPQLIENLLIQKRYEPIWARAEARAGPRLEKVRASAAADAQQSFEQDPNDPRKLQLLADALRHGGWLDEAIALRSRLPRTRDQMASLDEDSGWAVNNVALALADAGRHEEADQLFALLNEAPMEQGQYDWRVSMIINRLERLVVTGRFERAQPLIETTEKSARDDGNAYAQQLVREMKYCTYSRLGRKAEAEKLLPEVLQHAKDSYAATIDGLLCAGNIDEAERIALKALGEGNADFESAFVRALQPHRLIGDNPSVWQSEWTALRQRPAIAREYARLGRDMPEAFLVK